MADECCNNCGQICITVTICGAPASGDITVLAEGTGTTASIPVTYTGKVTGLVVLNPGTGYTAATVTIAAPGGGGTTATATATVSGGHVTGLTITNPGSGYTAVNPAVTITGDGTSATGRATATSIGCAAITQAGKYLITTTSPDGFTFQQVITATCTTNNATTSLARNGTIEVPFSVGACGLLGADVGSLHRPFPNGVITARNHATGAVVDSATTDTAGAATLHLPTQANTPSVYDIAIVDPTGRESLALPTSLSISSCQISSATIPAEMGPASTACLTASGTSGQLCTFPPLVSLVISGVVAGTAALTYSLASSSWVGTTSGTGGATWNIDLQPSTNLTITEVGFGSIYNGLATSPISCPLDPALLLSYTVGAGNPRFAVGTHFTVTE